MIDSWSRPCSKEGSSGGKANKQSKWLEQHVYHKVENSKRRPRPTAGEDVASSRNDAEQHGRLGFRGKFGDRVGCKRE
jgi:hypothetical protein